MSPHKTNQFKFQVFKQICLTLFKIFLINYFVQLDPSSLYTNYPRFSCNQSFKRSPSNSNIDGKTWETLPTSMSPSLSPESEKQSNLPRNHLKQTQTFLTIAVIFGKKYPLFYPSKQKKRRGTNFVQDLNSQKTLTFGPLNIFDPNFFCTTFT